MSLQSSVLPRLSRGAFGGLPMRVAPIGRDVRLMANAPAVEARRMVPLPKEDLIANLKSGNKPRSAWRRVLPVSLPDDTHSLTLNQPPPHAP